MKEIFVAKTVEEAKAAAVEAFGTNEENIRFEILEEPKKSLFGLIKGQAKISAVYEKVLSKSDIALDYIKGILKAIGLECSAEITESSEDSAVIEVKGEDVGTIIGRRGETLDSIQYLASMVANRNDKDYFRITVDSCGYREKRRETLEDLAVKIAKNVQKTGRTSTLEPMNPYERRIIHSAVSSIEGVTSRSVGEEPYRKVVISSTSKRPEKTSQDKRNNGNNNRRRGRNIPPRSLDLSTSFEKDYVKPVPKPKPEDNMDLELYGKIEINNSDNE